jgi:nitrite reductase/ring-hydroxylating ferredoxin subunit
MDRRRFLRTACQACAALAVAPAVASLESCSSGKSLAVDNGMLNIPLADLSKSGTTVVRAQGLGAKLMVVRRDDGSYTALLLNCPHKNGPVKEKAGVLTCDWHGSTFDRDGKVTKGPSKQDLKRYPVTVEGDQLRVAVG